MPSFPLQDTTEICAFLSKVICRICSVHAGVQLQVMGARIHPIDGYVVVSEEVGLLGWLHPGRQVFQICL